MASVVVFVERDRDRPRPASLGAVATARGLADSAGATVYALVCVTADSDLDALASALGSAGADRVAAALTDAPIHPTMWATSGAIIAQVCERLAPRLVLFAPTGAGRDIAPRLAARLGASYIPDAAVERTPAGELVFGRMLPGGARRARYRVAISSDARHVATLYAPPPVAALGDVDVDVVFFEVDVPEATLERREIDPDPASALESARVVVCAGGGVTAETLPMVESLGRALDGELAGTRTACRRGIVGWERMVGIGGRHIAPELYVAVGASGSESHLGAIAADAEIVAINADPAAPIIDVASYALVGDLAELLPQLVAELGA